MIGTLALLVITIDAAGFLLWIASGQYPPDSFYIGTITAHIIKLI